MRNAAKVIFAVLAVGAGALGLQVLQAPPSAPIAATATIAPIPTALPPTSTTQISAPTITPAAVTVQTRVVRTPQRPTRIPATASVNARLRAGPGTDYAILGGVRAGKVLTVVGRNEAGDWLKLSGGEWIAAWLVANAPGILPTVTIELTPPTRLPPPTKTRIPPAATPTSSRTGPTVDTGLTCDRCIKGNIGIEKGTRIYHIPGCPNYDDTSIREEYGERWFSSEAEALAAGWRKALNCP